MKTNPNDPVHPHFNHEGASGMSKLEYMSTLIMQGLRASLLETNSQIGRRTNLVLWSSENVAELAVKDAKALIEQLNKEHD